MTSITEFVRTSIYDITSPQFRLSKYMWAVFISLNRVHGAWRWYRRAALYSNPENFSQLIAGHLIKFICGESTLIRVAAQSVLIATRLIACAQQQKSLYKEGKRLIAAIKGDYAYPVDVPWITDNCSRFFSPSTVYSWKFYGLSQWHYLKRIAMIAAKIFVKAFTLSMSIMDAIEAFYISPITKNDALTECCLNIMQCLDSLVEQKEILLEGITSNKDLIERILKGSPFTYLQLKTSVASGLATTEQIQQGAKKIASFGNGVLVNVGRQAFHGALVVTGVKSLKNSFGA